MEVSIEGNLNIPEGENSDGTYPADTMLCEVEMDTEENTKGEFPGKDSSVEEPISAQLLPPWIKKQRSKLPWQCLLLP